MPHHRKRVEGKKGQEGRRESQSPRYKLTPQQQSAAKRDAFAEALFHGEGKEEVAGWIEGYLFKIEGGDDLENGEVKMSAGEVEAGDGADEPATTETETGAGGKGSSSDSSAEVETVSEGVVKVKLGQ